MLWYGSWCDTLTYDYACVRGCTEIWNLLVLCCVWRQRRSGDHVLKRLHDFVCIMYTYMILIRILTYWFVLHFVIWFAFGFDPYFCTPCFTYSVHISYWPPFFGGCVFMPRRYGRQVCWSARLGSHFCYFGALSSTDPIFWYSLSLLSGYVLCSGYDGALSRLMIMICSVEVCGYICVGSVHMFGIFCSVMALSAYVCQVCFSAKFCSDH